jgi:hypothetical protein
MELIGKLVTAPSTAFLAAAVTLLCTHFALYCAALRNHGSLATERAILLYHVKSAGLVAAAGLLFVLVAADTPRALAALVAALACQGIYSLTFLELWTLSQISYSREVLSLASREKLMRPEIVSRLAAVGDQKKASRLAALIKLGLVRQRGEAWVLSLRGLAAALLLKALLWLPDSRSHG